MSECFEKIKSVCPVCLKTIDACKTVGTDGLIYMEKTCPEHGASIDELTPRMISFNNPFGACPE